MYIATDENGRITASTEYEEYAGGMREFDLPEGFDFTRQYEYRVVDGELVHDPEPEPADVRIAQIKSKLAATDYVVLKMTEAATCGYSLSGDESERYAAIIEQRRAWREEINALEGGD